MNSGAVPGDSPPDQEQLTMTITDPSTECFHGGYHPPGECPEANAADPERIEFVEGLRELADFYERATDMPVPVVPTRIHLYVDGERFPRVARALGGRREKEATEDFFGVVRSFGPAVEVKVYSDREAVCERRVVGTEKVMVPDPDAPLVEAEREVVEWVCPESVLR